MKFRTTRKEMMKESNGVIKVGNGWLNTLLIYSSPIAYTAGVNGWNADIYDMGEVEQWGYYICKGDRPFGDIEPTYEYIERFEKIADEIRYGAEWHDYDRKAIMRELLRLFVKAAKTGVMPDLDNFKAEQWLGLHHLPTPATLTTDISAIPASVPSVGAEAIARN